MRVQHHFAQNGNIRLHYIDTGHIQDGGTPLIMLPGGMGQAEHYQREIEALQPRRCIAVNGRGVGRSDAPTSGYSPAEQVGDLEAVLERAALGRYAMFAYSMAVPVALATALTPQYTPSALIIGDYPPRFPQLTLEWVERVVMDFGSEVPAYVPQAMQAESAEHELWDDLHTITCPVLIMRGAGPGSLLTEEDAQRYLDTLPDAEEVVFEGTGHALWKPDYDRFIDTIARFLERID